MRLGFFGTPEIASYCLNELAALYEICFAVTSVDKPVKRSGTPMPSPVKKLALSKNIPVIQPENLNDPEFLNEIKKHRADIFVVVAYGKYIPKEVWENPRLKSINLHPSLLPKYRGAAPVQWALINGETETGVTIQLINEKFDAGDIVVQKTVPVPENMTAAELCEAVLPPGCAMLCEAIELLSSGKAQPVRQNESEATYCGKINRDTARINWASSPEKIHNLVRALNPKPAAWCVFRGAGIRIWKTCRFREEAGLKPGQIGVYQKKRLIAGSGAGAIEILHIQPDNKKIMDGLSFINGYRLKQNEYFE